MKVIKVTLVIHKVNTLREKFNLISSRHGDNNVINAEKIADLNDCKSY